MEHHVIDFSGFDPSLAAFKMDFKETQSSVDRKQQTNYDEVGQCLDKEVKSDKTISLWSDRFFINVQNSYFLYEQCRKVVKFIPDRMGFFSGQLMA